MMNYFRLSFAGITWILYSLFLRIADITHVGVAQAYSSIKDKAPLPGDIAILPTDNPGLEPFLGYWFGRWMGILSSQLVIEKVSENQATVVYSHGDFPFYGFMRSWSREFANVSDGKIIFGKDPQFTFHLSKSKQFMMGVRRFGTTHQFITMLRNTSQ